MQIQISWLLQKPTDLDLHCLQRQGISGFSRTRIKADNLGLVKWKNAFESRFRSSCACTKYHPGLCSWVMHSTVSMILLADSEGSDQTVWICRLIWAFAVGICPKTCFRFGVANFMFYDVKDSSCGMLLVGLKIRFFFCSIWSNQTLRKRSSAFSVQTQKQSVSNGSLLQKTMRSLL